MISLEDMVSSTFVVSARNVLYVSSFPTLRSNHQTLAEDTNVYASSVDVTEAKASLSLVDVCR